ncbi:LysE family transporter, partial [Streptococcus pneumoniae]
SIYMLYLIYTLFRKHSENKVENDIGTFYSGFALQFLNPKVVTFTMTVIPTFVLVNQPSTLMISIYVIMTSIIALISFSFWIFFLNFA